MRIRKTGKYDNNKKEFIVLEYCCAQMGRDMKEYPHWEITDGEMSCYDSECGVGGKFCSHCGQQIIFM